MSAIYSVHLLAGGAGHHADHSTGRLPSDVEGERIYQLKLTSDIDPDDCDIILPNELIIFPISINY